jgi:hypothetical protein
MTGKKLPERAPHIASVNSRVLPKPTLFVRNYPAAWRAPTRRVQIRSIGVELKQIQQSSLEETAAALSISAQATKARLFRAKGTLKNRLVSHARRQSAPMFRAPIIPIPPAAALQNVPGRVSDITPRAALRDIA